MTSQPTQLNEYVAEGPWGHQYYSHPYNPIPDDLTLLERKVEPNGGDLGRGMFITKDKFDSLDLSAYAPFEVSVCKCGEARYCIPIYGASGALVGQWWRGFYRKDDPTKFISFECYERF